MIAFIVPPYLRNAPKISFPASTRRKHGIVNSKPSKGLVIPKQCGRECRFARPNNEKLSRPGAVDPN